MGERKNEKRWRQINKRTIFVPRLVLFRPTVVSLVFLLLPRPASSIGDVFLSCFVSFFIEFQEDSIYKTLRKVHFTVHYIYAFK